MGRGRPREKRETTEREREGEKDGRRWGERERKKETSSSLLYTL